SPLSPPSRRAGPLLPRGACPGAARPWSQAIPPVAPRHNERTGAGVPGQAVRAEAPPESGPQSRLTSHEGTQTLLRLGELRSRIQRLPEGQLLVGGQGNGLRLCRLDFTPGLGHGHGADIIAEVEPPQ